MSRRSKEQDLASSRGRPERLPKRWSAQRKAEVVLRLLRGEDIGEVSREVRVAPPELERWRRVFLDGGQQGPEGEEPDGRAVDANPGEAGRDDDAGRAAGGAPGKKGVRGRASEALEAVGRVSPATDRAYPLTMVCETWQVARSSVYALRAQVGGEPVQSRTLGKRGPKTALSDEELAEEIRTVLKVSPFLGEGHQKVKARLAAKGIRTGKNRVLSLMRAHGLLAQVRRGHPRGDRSHSGRIRTERPDELWGTDASRFWTKSEGWCWFFAAVDHCASDVVGWHVAKKGDRWAALEPVRQGVRAHIGGFGKAIALGARLGLAVQGKTVPARDQMARHPLHARIRGRAGVQRRRRALHPGRSRRSASICTTSKPSRRPGK